jgi:hypothetical protein
MKRAAIERKRAVKVWKKHFEQHVRQNVQSGGQRPIMCPCDLQVNRFRKGQKMFGCGRPRCYVCHGDKLLGNTKHSVKKRELIGSDE